MGMIQDGANAKYLRDCEAAQRNAAKYWKKTQEFGPVAIDPWLEKMLNAEHQSVKTTFRILCTMALSGPTDYLRADGTPHGMRVMVESPGGRRWDQRSLAATAKLAVGSVRYALKRLKELGLVFIEASRLWGTYVLIKSFTRFLNPRSWRNVVGRSASNKSRSAERVSMVDTFDLPPANSSQLTSTVDVQIHQKEGDSSPKPRIPEDSRRGLGKIFPEIPSWAL